MTDRYLLNKSLGVTFNLGPELVMTPDQGDHNVLAYCLGLVDDENTGGWAVEFGVGSGATLRLIAEHTPVIGFDSFMGLPEDWRPGFPRGMFAAAPPRDIAGATIVEGLFADTVPNYEWPDRISLVHFDADLYSSTKTALDSIGHHLWHGCILVFDEFFGYEGAEDHEQRAWFEYAHEWSIPFTVIGHGREQWAVRLV